MNKRNIAICLVLFVIGVTGGGVAYSTVPEGTLAAPRASRTAEATSVKVYLVAVGDNGKKGRKIGCDDSLLAVTRTIEPTTTPLKAALEELLSMPDEQTEAGLQLGNFWKGSDLKVKKVSLKSGTASIWITGTLTVAGICDEPRITEQITATARQFKTVKRVKVWVNGVPLARAIR